MSKKKHPEITFTMNRMLKEDIDYITSKIGSTDKSITVLMNKNHKYYVVSSVMKIIENDLSMFELPFNIPNDIGKVYNQ